MDEDKKKRKNNKKKNKHANKPTENVTLDEKELTSGSQTHAAEAGQRSDSQVSLNVDGDGDAHLANGTSTNLSNADEQYWLDKEVSSEEKIKELQAEMSALGQKKALLEARINQLLKENDDYLQKDVSPNEKIQQLCDEKNASLQHENYQKEKIIQLEKEKDALIEKGGRLDQKTQQLQKEIDMYLQKENSAMELISTLTNQNTRLQSQVIELEQSGESLLEEKQRIISDLQLQIENLESATDTRNSSKDQKFNQTSESGDAYHQIAAVEALIEKLITEKSELVEKVSELYGELDRKGSATDNNLSVNSIEEYTAAQPGDLADGSLLSPAIATGADDGHRAAQTADSIAEAGTIIHLSSSTHSLEDIMLEDQRDGEHPNYNDGLELPKFPEIVETDRTVQVPSDELEVQEVKKLKVVQNDEKTDIPLTDAPLIGAPFRLISFVARYVSGADLVDRTSRK